jgi:hypothetical protein
MGGGCAYLDYDGDGWQDLFLISSGNDFHLARQTPASRLFRNLGNGKFADVTEQARIRFDGYAMGCCVGDWDNDGREDLFITGFGRNCLLRNRGDGTFEDRSEEAGILPRKDAWGTGCAFVDIDRDGWLDLYVANYVRFDPKIPLCRSGNTMSGCTPNQYETQRNELYLNRRNGRFSECAVERGADDPAGAGLGVLVCDFDNDGWPDIFVANDGTPNALLHNKKGRFRNVGDASGVAYAEAGVMRAGMGTDAADQDLDGKFDLVITNFQHEPNSLYRNNCMAGSMDFSEITYPSGIGTPSVMRLAFGTVFADFDRDGRPDLYVGNGHVYDNVAKFDDTATFEQQDQVYRNLGAGTFRELPPATGALPEMPSVSRGVAAGDIDNDGAPDVLINNLGRPARLLRNEPTGSGHWLGLRLKGSRSNRSAIGARVELRSPAGLQVREVRSGGSYISQSDLRPLFGLGASADAGELSIEIRWPNGNRQTVRPSAVDQYLEIREKDGGGAP